MGLLKEEFTDRNILSVKKMIVCLKYLNLGSELSIGNNTYKIGETNNKGFNLLQKLQSTTNGVTTDKWFGYHGNIITFSEEVATLTNEECKLISANVGLTLVNKKSTI